MSLTDINANASIIVVDSERAIKTSGDTASRLVSITGGNALIIAAATDRVDGALDGSVTASFAGNILAPIISSFRADGEVASALFFFAEPMLGNQSASVTFGTLLPSDNQYTRLSILTLSGVDLTNPFGSSSTNNDKSTGITLSNIEAGNLSMYAIGAQQGLGNPPLDINDTDAASEPGFVDINNGATRAGTKVIIAALSQQFEGEVSYSHFQTTRDAAALALEINSQHNSEIDVPTPSIGLLLLLGLCSIATYKSLR